MSIYFNQFKKYLELTKKDYSDYLEVADAVKKVMEPYPEKPSKKAIVILGYSGNGKSTWINEFCNKNKNYLVVSMDTTVKELRNKKEPFSQGDIINEFGNSLERASLEGKNIVVDGNFLNLLTRSALTDTLKLLDYNINLVDLTPNIDFVLQRRIWDEAGRMLGIPINEDNYKQYSSQPLYKTMEKRVLDFYQNEKERSNFDMQVSNNLLGLGVNSVFCNVSPSDMTKKTL